MNRHPKTRRTLLVLAATLALIVPGVLYSEGVSVQVIGLVLLSYMIGLIAYPLGVRHRGEGQAPGSAAMASTSLHLVQQGGEHSIEHYHARLLDHLEHNWRRFQEGHRNTEKVLTNVIASLDKALELTHGTEMLAANTLLSATECGEVGRGFISVSRDLINLSERSLPDLQKLRQLLRGLGHELARFCVVVECSPDGWLSTGQRLPVPQLAKLRTEIVYCQQQLQQLSDHYRREPQQDVRWLQLGDAVRRLVNELINTLFQLELHIQDVLSDMRLLRLAEGAGETGQIVEIKDRIHAIREAGGATQKFMT